MPLPCCSDGALICQEHCLEPNNDIKFSYICFLNKQARMFLLHDVLLHSTTCLENEMPWWSVKIIWTWLSFVKPQSLHTDSKPQNYFIKKKTFRSKLDVCQADMFKNGCHTHTVHSYRQYTLIHWERIKISCHVAVCPFVVPEEIHFEACCICTMVDLSGQCHGPPTHPINHHLRQHL